MRVCKKCGEKREYVGRCIPCKARQNANRYKRDAEKIKRYNTEYREKNKLRIIADRKRRYEENKPAILRESKAWRDRNKAKVRSSDRKKKYGLTKEAFSEMLVSQLGCCAICLLPMQKIHVDHSHISGKVRGLLCGRCNCGIGHLKDSPKNLRAAALYLERHSL